MYQQYDTYEFLFHCIFEALLLCSELTTLIFLVIDLFTKGTEILHSKVKVRVSRALH